jgi:lipopolysaccharide transport system ATP-binding protein
MSDTVIRVEHISKKYVLDHQQQGGSSYKSLREAIADGTKSLFKPLTQNLELKPKNSAKQGITLVFDYEAIGI